jgi:hypothetical protein
VLTLNFAPHCGSPQKRIKQLNFGRRNDPVLDLLRRTWRETNVLPAKER